VDICPHLLTGPIRDIYFYDSSGVWTFVHIILGFL
jgi:hypothetical protein